MVKHPRTTLGDDEDCYCRDIIVLICLVIFHDHVAKASRKLMRRSPSS